MNFTYFRIKKLLLNIRSYTNYQSLYYQLLNEILMDRFRVLILAGYNYLRSSGFAT